MDKFLETVRDIWSISFVQALVYLIVAFVAAGVASALVKGLCKVLKLDAKLDKLGVNEGQVGTSIKFIGKLVYLVVFMLFLPSALSALGLHAVSAPITGFVSTIVNYIPNIIAALILVFVGIYIGQLITQIVIVLLAKTKIDVIAQKMGAKEGGLKLSFIIGKALYGVIILIALVQALTVLGIEAISTPALTIINSIFAAIPNILLAAIVIACGILVANIACGLLNTVLEGVNLDSLVGKIIPQISGKFSATKVVVNVVRAIIMLFIVAQGVEILGFTLLTGIASAIIAYLPMVIKALIIAFVAFIGANIAESALTKAMPNCCCVGKIAKATIIVVASFMVLSQLDFATTIVNSAFIIILCGLSLAFAIAFGIGGKDFAKKTLDKVSDNKDEEKK